MLTLVISSLKLRCTTSVETMYVDPPKSLILERLPAVVQWQHYGSPGKISRHLNRKDNPIELYCEMGLVFREEAREEAIEFSGFGGFGERG